jgi:hypothetical protein
VNQPFQLAWDVPGGSGGTISFLPRPSRTNFWRIADKQEQMPLTVPPEAQLQAERLRQWTGMSNRALASLLGTTHPTIGAVLSGQSSEFLRRPDVRRRLADLYAMCSRLAPLVGEDPKELSRILQASEGGEGGRTVGELAVNGDLARGYLIALQAIAPVRTQAFSDSPFPAQSGTATHALHD